MERQRRIMGDDHPNTLGAISNLAGVLRMLGELEEAEALFREALDRRRRVLGEAHPHTLTSINNVGYVLQARGRLAEAEPFYREALERRRRVLGPDHPDTVRSNNNVGSVLEAQGKLVEAEPFFAESFRLAQNSQNPPDIAAVYVSRYGPCLVKLGKYDQAEQPLREAERRLRQTGQANSREMRGVLAGLAEVCDQTDRPDEAARWRAELARIQPASGPASNPSAT
jgi:tetratricopeptide (TPR) repeat protein